MSTMKEPVHIIPYDPYFLGSGLEVPLPVPNEKLAEQLHVHDGTHVLDYTHFSLAVHAERHTAVFSACNIDGRRIVKGIDKKSPWKFDRRAGDFQLGGEAYDGTAWDKGHLTKREDVIWGPPQEAKWANDATFFYTNAAPQHGNFNRDEWQELENWIFDWADEDQYRLCVITGPVLRKSDRRLSEGDPELRRVILLPEKIFIPAAFWKIVALRDRETRELAVAAFAMRQAEMWDDQQGSLHNLTVHQVTVQAIAKWTGLDFGPLAEADALDVAAERNRSMTRAATGEMFFPVVNDREDILRPSLIGRSARVAFGRSASAAAPGCGCGGVEFDAKSAIDALSRDVARLTEAVAAMAAPPAAWGERSIGAAAGAARSVAAPERSIATAGESAEAILARVRFDPRAAADITRIVGGAPVSPGEFPYTCCIGSFAQYFCTGVLIGKRIVVTAAHCGSSIANVYFGDAIPSEGGTGIIVPVKRVIIHPDYDRFAFVRNDITVLILSKDAPVDPVDVASGAELSSASDVTLVGFGFSDPMKPIGFGTKRKVTVPMGVARRDDAEDLSALEQRFGFSSHHEFVAGRKLLGRDSCNGDSGGPAFVDAGGTIKVAGVTSRATREAMVNCGDGGIYVRLDQYLEWIAGVTA